MTYNCNVDDIDRAKTLEYNMIQRNLLSYYIH